MLIQVFIAMCLGVLAGLTFGPQGIFVLDLIGTLFLNALSLIVVPLIFSSIIKGMARLGKEKGVKKLTALTFFYFFITVIVAAIFGFSFASYFQPGILQEPLLTLSNETVLQKKELSAQIFELAQRFIPKNLFKTAVEGNLLGVSIFSLLFGYFTTKLPEKQFTIIFDFFTAILDVIMEITKFIIKFLPIGVFGLIGYTISQTGFHALYTAGIFFFFAVSGLLIYVVLFLVPLLLFEGISPLQHFKTVSPALITALSTSSSAATVPVTMESLEIDGGIPNRIVSFVIPLGTTVNLTAAAFYCSFTSLFLAQVMGATLSFADQLSIFVLSIFSGFGMVAGIPSGSLIALIIILETVGIDAKGLGLIMAAERFLDMGRTFVNVLTNSIVCAIVHKKSL